MTFLYSGVLTDIDNLAFLARLDHQLPILTILLMKYLHRKLQRVSSIFVESFSGKEVLFSRLSFHFKDQVGRMLQCPRCCSWWKSPGFSENLCCHAFYALRARVSQMLMVKVLQNWDGPDLKQDQWSARDPFDPDTAIKPIMVPAKLTINPKNWRILPQERP